MPTIEWNRTWVRNLRHWARVAPWQLYGLQWGDPLRRGARYRLSVIKARLLGKRPPFPLYKVVDRYISPYVESDSTVLEIGAGGGRWTRCFLKCRKVIVAEINPEFFDYLSEWFPHAPLEFYRSEGNELSGIEDATVDFVFSFGCLVHVDPEDIRAYLSEIARVLKPGGTAVLQYADKEKPAGARIPEFSDMNTAKMEAMAILPIIHHDTELMLHSNIVVLQKS